MPETAAQLILTVGICSLVGFCLVALICGETQQRKHDHSPPRIQSVPEMCSSVGDHSMPKAWMVSSGHSRQTKMTSNFISANRWQAERDELRLKGFTRRQIDHLIIYRAAYRAGHYQLDFLLPGRLQFARWLYQRGKING